jgi:hypothetical protein
MTHRNTDLLRLIPNCYLNAPRPPSIREQQLAAWLQNPPHESQVQVQDCSLKQH